MCNTYSDTNTHLTVLESQLWILMFNFTIVQYISGKCRKIFIDST